MLKRPLFIHGWAFSSKVFGKLPGIKVDLPSHGASRERYSGFGNMVKGIALRLSSGHDVVGWSLGGSVALLLALQFPSRVNRLFLIGTSPFFGRAWQSENIRAFRLMVRRKGITAFRQLALGREFEDELEEKGAMKMLEDYIALDLRDRLPMIRKKVFIIHGEKDRVVPPKEAIRLYTLVKGSKLIFLPGGHFPAEDERSLFATLLKVGGDL